MSVSGYIWILISLKNISGIQRAIFEIELDGRENVFMSVATSESDDRCVVMVNSNAFLNLWRNEPYSIHSEISMGNVSTWKNDYKYHYAVDGFSQGFSNPVPLASIVCQRYIEEIPIYRKKLFFKKLVRIEENTVSYVSFINGITRTIWLLVNDAKCFPVECSNKVEAEQLALLAGHDGINHKTVKQLFKNT